jgi:hypothetical protein
LLRLWRRRRELHYPRIAVVGWCRNLHANNPSLDDGESNDSEDAVDQDVREAQSINNVLES